MELRHLRYFVAVAEELHFRRAAERLHIAQPAVSEQIRKLEAELGVQLFVRGQRSVSLTAAGTAMLEEARRALHQADLAQRAARHADERTHRRLRLGYLPDALPPAVPWLLRRLAATAPDLSVSLETGAARRLLEDVRDGRLDVAVVCLPAPVSGLRTLPIAHEGTVAAVPFHHPCAAEPELALAGLQRTRLVQLARSVNPAFYDGVLAACRSAGIAPSLLEIAQPAIEQVLLAVASGAGIALLPASAESRFATPGVRFLPLAAPAPRFQVALVTRTELSAATTSLLRLARPSAEPQPVELAAA
jgi:DNA-binding transcriptional LysR family regulator